MAIDPATRAKLHQRPDAETGDALPPDVHAAAAYFRSPATGRALPVEAHRHAYALIWALEDIAGAKIGKAPVVKQSGETPAAAQ